MNLSERILAHLEVCGPQSAWAVAKALKVGYYSVRPALSLLLKAGAASKEGNLYSYAAPLCPTSKPDTITDADLSRMPPHVRDAAVELIERRRHAR